MLIGYVIFLLATVAATDTIMFDGSCIQDVNWNMAPEGRMERGKWE
jgi:hypothetical protein